MTRAAWVLFVAALGLAIAWSTPMLMSWAASDGPTTQAPDVEGSLAVFFGLGGTVFALLGAWIGWATWARRRDAAWMCAAAWIATVAIVVSTGGTHLRGLLQCRTLTCDSAAVLLWVLVAGAAATGIGVWIRRRSA